MEAAGILHIAFCLLFTSPQPNTGFSLLDERLPLFLLSAGKREEKAMVTDVPTGPPVNVESFSCIAGRTTHAPVEVGQVVVRASGLALDCLHGQSCSLACVCDVLLQRTRYNKMTTTDT
jgi:hypothetical protein